MIQVKKLYYCFGAVLVLTSFALLTGCGNNAQDNTKTQASSEQTKSSEETFENDTISITLDSNKYAVENNKEFYKPSIRIVKTKEEYIAVQQLKNGNEKITLNDDGTYTNEKLKSEFQEYISKLTGFSDVTEEKIGDKTLYKTTTAVNAVDSDIYRTLTENKNVYKITVSGPNFKDTDEAKKLLADLKLK